MCSLANDPIVVLGAPRSGTTYLRQILDSHPRIAMTNEFRVFEWLRRAIALSDDPRAMLEGREPFVAWLGEELPARVRSYYARLAPDARWWGDKNPHYAEQPATLKAIRSWYPGARFVHIVRDPRAVVTSLLRKHHADGTAWVHAEEAHVMVATHQRNATQFVAECGEGTGRELRYEDLVGDDEAVARDLFAWLEVPFAPEVERFCREQRQRRTSFSGPTTDLSQAGSRDATRAAWSETVPPAHQRDSLQFLAPLLLAYGYEDEASLDALNRALPDATNDAD